MSVTYAIFHHIADLNTSVIKQAIKLLSAYWLYDGAAYGAGKCGYL